MVLITFQHSIKYIYAQLVPYLLLTAIAGFGALYWAIWWLPVYLIMGVLLAWRLIELTSVCYLFTHDMLIITRGVIFKQVDCRALWQLSGIEVRRNRLLGWLHVSHIYCGLEGPPADRIRFIGVDDGVMHKALDLLNDGIERNRKMWEEHFQQQTA